MNVWWLAGALLAAGPRFSGVLGQSQPADAAPLPFCGANGAVVDETGRLWTAAGTTLYGFDGPLLAAKLTLPAPVGSLAPRWDGQRLFYPSGGRCYRVDLSGRRAEPLGNARLSDKLRAFAVLPVGLASGYGDKGKLFVLEGDTVSAYGDDGAPRGTVLSLTRPPGAGWWYCSLGFEPASGDLLVGSYYPDSRIYRFDGAGREVTTDGWPRTGQSASLDIVRGQAWAVRYGSGAFPLPAKLERGAVLLDVGPQWTQYVNGLAASPGGGYWLASSQGLVRYDARGRETGQRLGGLDGVCGLALAADGTVIASVEHGQRLVRLGLDDEPTTPLRCTANEPWRCAAGWSARAAGLAADGDRFVVADEVNGQLWAFDPGHTGWGEQPWLKLGEPHALGQPRCVTVSDQRLWVLDGARVLSATRPDLTRLEPLALPDLAAPVALAAIDDDHLVAATAERVVAYGRQGTEWRLVWQQPLASADALAADDTHLAVTAAGAVTVLRASDGQRVGQVATPPGGWHPGALALRSPWLVVAEAAGHRLVRFRLGE